MTVTVLAVVKPDLVLKGWCAVEFGDFQKYTNYSSQKSLSIL